MTFEATREVAEGLLATMKGAFIEAINSSRQLTENEFHALVQCYIKAKPHLSQEFEVQWCADLLTIVDFDEIRTGEGNAPETLQCLIENMLKSK